MIIYWKHSVLCIFNKNTEEYNVKTSENNVKHSDFNMGDILEVGHPGIWSRDINIWGTVLGIYLHFLRKIRFLNSMSRAY